MSSKPKAKKPCYVLIIEDNVHHAEILTETLDRHFAPVVIHTVDTIKDGIDYAGQASYDLILTGAVIRDIPITDSLQKISRLAEGTPIIVISGRGDERLAAEIIKRGATEYLVKTRETLEMLPNILEKHIRSHAAAGRRKASSRALPDDTAKHEASPAAIIREVDKLTQQALAIVGPRRRKRGSTREAMEQLDQLLGQIKKLRELASKMNPKE